MASPYLGLSPELLIALFPFHLAFDRDLTITQMGEVLQRICAELIAGDPLAQHFRISRPPTPIAFDTIRERAGMVFLLSSLHHALQLKGQMVYVEPHQVMLFLCSPYVTELNDLEGLGFTLNDFALHHPVGDFLFLLQAQKTALVDAQKLTEQLRASQARVRQYADELEVKVGERTAELAAANAEIRALNKQLTVENLRLGAELEITRQLQRMILPSTDELDAIEGLDIAAYMEPAHEVGGDYYDILQHNGQIKIGIGDVTGHGLESGVVMVMTQAVVRALLTLGETDPVRFLDALNRALYGNVQRMGTDKNLTLSLIDYKNGEVKLSGQHEEMIVVRRDGVVELVDTIDLGFPIALDYDIADFINHTTVKLRPGDGFVLYTDGVTEAANLESEQYGLERLCEVVQTHWSEPAQAIKEAVVDDVRRHIGEQEVYDDITLVVVKQL